jgi:hypothetical protein
LPAGALSSAIQLTDQHEPTPETNPTQKTGENHNPVQPGAVPGFDNFAEQAAVSGPGQLLPASTPYPISPATNALREYERFSQTLAGG